MVSIDNHKMLDESLLKEFEKQLEVLLGAIFDPDQPFKQTGDLDACIYCSFRGICNR